MRYATARLDEFERLPAFGQHGVWRPVRHHFGIEGFGINAYSADQPGDRVIEEHDELGAAGAGRHQELYVVLTGRASFVLDGEDVDAPAGTFVFIGEPDVVRGAVAAEAATTVLAIGARPGHAFTVSPWEYRFRAQAIGGAEGFAILDEAAERFPDNATVPFDRAALHALAGQREEALDALRRAVELDPAARAWAAQDDDFSSLRGDPEFEALVGS
jgi:tetratricopeptide (TPR) repeat protein